MLLEELSPVVSSMDKVVVAVTPSEAIIGTAVAITNTRKKYVVYTRLHTSFYSVTRVFRVLSNPLTAVFDALLAMRQ